MKEHDIYGVLDSDNCHIDISNSLKGTKRYATLNGYNNVSVRYNCGYFVSIVAEKIGTKWENKHENKC